MVQLISEDKQDRMVQLISEDEQKLNTDEEILCNNNHADTHGIYKSKSLSKYSTSRENINRTDITDMEKKKIHNRSCTRKQRRKAYRHEIIKRDIYKRFTITDIKNVLRQLKIDFSIVNTTISQRTNTTTLFIGIKTQELIPQYEAQLQYLFTREHYYRTRIQKRSKYHR